MKVYNFKGMEVMVSVITTITPNRINLYDAITKEPLLTATSNIPTLRDLEGYVAVKDYSENEGVLDFLVENGIVEPPITFVKEEYVTFPICKIKSL